MQTPLLALTLRRRPAPSPDGIGADNMRQLIQLRWLAVLGQFVTIVTVRFGMGVQLPTEALLGVVILLALVNLAGLFLLGQRHVSNAEFLFALLFDVGMLTAQLFLSGGADNPFIALYLVQIVLGAILLTAGLVWVLVAVTTGCYAFLTTQHRSLVFPPGLQRDVADLYTLCHWLSFAIVAVLLVMFIARISRNLRARDTYLADMRQHAAEWRMSVTIDLQRCTSDCMSCRSAASSASPARPGMRCQSLRMTASEASGVPSSCAAPEANRPMRTMLSSSAACWRMSAR
jgi:two-component system sensor histidine kinase RegB